MSYYSVPKIGESDKLIEVTVPVSKSIANRILLLSAIGNGCITLLGGTPSEDSVAFLRALATLGVHVFRKEEGVMIDGQGAFPEKKASIHVQKAGTAARFLTVALAFSGGEYYVDADEQMKKRPMTEIFDLLRSVGVEFEFEEEENSFPFTMHSKGVTATEFTIDTDVSTQFCTAVLLSAPLLNAPVTLHTTGKRTDSRYIEITLNVMTQFGYDVEKIGNNIFFRGRKKPQPNIYAVEPDVSGACYFYALSLLLKRRVLVHGVHPDSMQGDFKFLKVLESKGVKLIDTTQGLIADGRDVKSFTGFDLVMTDFSDQALTVAALAPFATSKTVIRGVAHIKRQESDRIQSIVENLKKLGVPAESNRDDIFITPSPIQEATLKTYGDHRVAMAFALVGMKTGKVYLDDPDCSAKTFPDFFEIVESIAK